MSTTAMRGSSTTGLLDGTLPLRPFHPDGFVGTHAGGRPAGAGRGPGLRRDAGGGPQPGRLRYQHRRGVLPAVEFDRRPVHACFQLAGRVARAGAAPAQRGALQAVRGAPGRHPRSPCPGAGAHGPPHRRHPAPARLTRDAEAVGRDRSKSRNRCTSIPLPASRETGEAAGLGAALRAGQLGRVRPAPAELSGAPRTPCGCCSCTDTPQHPEWPVQWAEALWQRGLASDLITPLPALGMRAWRLSGDLLAWSALVGEGVREGWLPWKEPEPR